MSEQENKRPSLPQRPATDDREAWLAYWQAQVQSWRTKPEINRVRQAYLANRLAITPDIKQCIYPFKGIKLTRADVEWLLGAHENGYGPVDWSYGGLRERQGLDLRGADLRDVNLSRLPLTGIVGALVWDDWLYATPEQREAALVCLEGADLSFIHLERAVLRGVHLEKAILYGAHLEGAHLYSAHLEGAILKQAFFDNRAQLGKIVLENKKFGVASLADVHWNGVDLAEVDWEVVKVLGEEQTAHRQKRHDGMTRYTERQFNEYRRAVRANRQLASVLQGQGLNEYAARFAYRANMLQRRVLWLYAFLYPLKLLQRVHTLASYLFSLFLDWLAGYGYRPMRSLGWYLVIILGFAVAYSAFAHLPFLPDAFVFSLASFHGRGFFPSLGDPVHPLTLHDPLVVLAAFEAVIGLLIEISFIATFTQRFFGR